MKKVFALLLSLTLVLTLVACGGSDDETEDRQPRLYGVRENVTITVNDEYDPLDGVEAVDPEDGDITADIDVSGSYDTTNQGNYTITISVEDSAGNTDSKQVNLTVEDPTSTNSSPVILAPTSRSVATDQYSFDLMDIGVTAYDSEDGDLTGQLTIDQGDFDQSVPGVYVVTYSVTDSEGVATTKTVSIEVYEFSGDNPRKADSNTLVVGTTEFSGEFIFWGGSSSYDVAVRDLVNGAGVIATTRYGQFVYNDNVLVTDPVIEIETDEDGNVVTKSYTFTVKEGMLWSDGEEITAEDYVFGMKMFSAYSMSQAGHTGLATGSELVGYDAWRNGGYGEFNEDGEWVLDDTRLDEYDFDGVQLVDDYTFTLVIDGENLPYFYELNMVAAGPQPKHVYTNDGEYDFLSKTEHEALGEEDMHIGSYIEQYKSAPPVSSGAYVFDRYVPGQFVQMSLNENYVGNYLGQVPEIENVIIKVVPSATDMEHLLTGDIDILTGLVEGAKINRGLETEYLYEDTYLRIGYGAIFFHTDFGPTQQWQVRQAFGYLVDRAQFVDAFLEGFGVNVQGPYGLGQWMVQESVLFDEGNDELFNYAPDIEEAVALLEDAGWIYDENGDAYVQGDGTVRYNEAGEPLRINWLGTISDYSDLLGPILEAGTSQVGIDLRAEQADFATLIDHYYYAYTLDPADRQYHMFNLATSFTALYDPWYSYNSANLGTTYNSNQFADTAENPQKPLDRSADAVTRTVGDFTYVGPELSIDELTENMRNLEGSQTDEFLCYWEMFQIRMNDLLPVLPLYSNEYYHFANVAVQGLSTTGFWNWQQSIVDMTIVDSE